MAIHPPSITGLSGGTPSVHFPFQAGDSPLGFTSIYSETRHSPTISFDLWLPTNFSLAAPSTTIQTSRIFTVGMFGQLLYLLRLLHFPTNATLPSILNTSLNQVTTFSHQLPSPLPVVVTARLLDCLPSHSPANLRAGRSMSLLPLPFTKGRDSLPAPPVAGASTLGNQTTNPTAE